MINERGWGPEVGMGQRSRTGRSSQMSYGVGEGSGTKDTLCVGKTWLWCKSVHLGGLWCNQACLFVCVTRNNVFATIPFRYTSKFKGIWEHLYPRQGRGLMYVCLVFLKLLMKHETDLKILQKNPNFTFFNFFGSKKAIALYCCSLVPRGKV